MTPRPQCAVVIPTFDGAHLLGPCLEALLAQPPDRCEMSIIVVDDGSSDGTAGRFASYADRIRLIRRRQNRGFAETCNEGARAAGSAEYLVFLNNDTIPFPGWLDSLLLEAETHPEAAAVGAKLLYPDGTVQHAGIVIGEDRHPHHIYAGFPGEHPAVNRSKVVPAVTAACMLVRRSVFDELEGFDTAFLNGYEDIDFCLRLGRLGHQIRYCPQSVLHHLESVTRWRDWDTRDVNDNCRLFEERWLDRIEPDDVEHYLADGLISVSYADTYPVQLAISPLLATIKRDGEGEDALERVLAARARQVVNMRANRTRELLEERREAVAATRTHSGRSAPDGSPRVLHEGDFHKLGSAMGRRRASVLMPVKNSAADLRCTLPGLFKQEAGVELEIVAVDSGSSDDTIDVLKEFGATVIAIDPAEFDHGLTRNLAAEHARGDALIFLNSRSRPCDGGWLATLLGSLESQPDVAGVCSRVVPHSDASLLTRRDVELDPSASPKRVVKRIDDWDLYRAMPVEERRLLLNFHTVSAAIRPSVLNQIPFRSVRTIGEDLLWAREVLEAGLALVHEPASRVYHSHDYSLREWFMRNVDDGIANQEINGRTLSEEQLEELVRGMIASDWRFLRDDLGLHGEELERLQVEAAMRRIAQGAGQWLGANHSAFPPDAVGAFSRVGGVRRSGG